MLDNLQDNGYEFTEEVEQHEKAEERLLWIKRGFAWCYEMTERQREVAYYKLFKRLTLRQIAKILNIHFTVVHRHWQKAIKQGSKVDT